MERRDRQRRRHRLRPVPRRARKSARHHRPPRRFNGLTCGTAYQVGRRRASTRPATRHHAANDVGHHIRLRGHPAAHRADQRHRLDAHHHEHQPHLGAVDRQHRCRRLRLYNGGELVDTTAGTTGIVSGLTCGTNYTLAVDAFDASGNSSAQDHRDGLHPPLRRHHPADRSRSTSPANGSTVTGTINASATATDNVGVTRVEFFRDGVSLGSDTSSPYSIAFNTTTIAERQPHVRCPRLRRGRQRRQRNQRHGHRVEHDTAPRHRAPTCPLPAYPDATAPACRPGRRSRRAAV